MGLFRNFSASELRTQLKDYTLGALEICPFHLNVDLLLGRCLQRRPNIKTRAGERLVLAVKC